MLLKIGMVFSTLELIEMQSEIKANGGPSIIMIGKST